MHRFLALPHTLTWTKKGAIVLASSCVALGASGCAGASYAFDSIAGTPEAVELMALSPAQTMRDIVARSEAATAERATQLAALATECTDCATLLTSTSETAEARLRASGGVWEPWGDFADREDVTSFVELPPQGTRAGLVKAPEAPDGRLECPCLHQLAYALQHLPFRPNGNGFLLNYLQFG